MTKQEKQKWIIEYLKVHKYVDIFDEDFVDSYIQECKPNCIEYKIYGAHFVSELSRYLAELYHQNILVRYTIGLSNSKDGYPKWCYSYELK